MLAQRKYERRDASSMSLTGNATSFPEVATAAAGFSTATAVFAITAGGRARTAAGFSKAAEGFASDSTRNRKFGDERIACRARRIPSLKLSPFFCASVTSATFEATSSLLTGRRYARSIRPVRIVFAHAGVVCAQVK